MSNLQPRRVTLEPVTYGKASRRNIFEASICQLSSQYNRDIRRALGFRETSYGKGVPQFTSARVSQLYSELDRLAREVLPNESHEELKRAWKRKEFTADIKGLLDEFGEEIWGEPLEQRSPALNPPSPLLAAGENGASSGLEYGSPSHRNFIALQLEHLAYVKALRFHENHVKKREPTQVGGREHESATTPTQRNTSPSSSRERYLVVLRLAPHKLEAFTSGSSTTLIQKRKHRSNKTVGSLSDPDTESGREGNPRKRRQYQRPRKKRQYQRPRASCNEDRARDSEVIPANEQSDHDETNQEDRKSIILVNDDAQAVEQSRSEEVLKADLLELLYGEFCLDDDDSSHTKLSPESMLDKSQQLDSLVRRLWNIREELSKTHLEDRFDEVYMTLDTWLSWREACWLLCEVTGIHPFGGQPIPLLTLAQWEENLGGGKECRKFHQKLFTYRRKLAASKIHDGNNDTALRTAQCLTWVFAALTGSPFVEDVLQEHLIAYNKVLFSWNLDLWLG